MADARGITNEMTGRNKCDIAQKLNNDIKEAKNYKERQRARTRLDSHVKSCPICKGK